MGVVAREEGCLGSVVCRYIYWFGVPAVHRPW
jgi:hypothetical protein